MTAGHLHLKATRTRRGFTLVELMIASMMYATIMASLVALYFTTVRMREGTYRRLERDMPWSMAANTIRRDLSSVVPPVGLMRGEFVGEPDESSGRRMDILLLHTASGRLDDLEPWGDIQRVEYSLEQPITNTNQPGLELVRWVNRNLLPNIEEEPERIRLLRGVDSLEFEYYAEEVWEASWDSTELENAIPEAVSIRITFTEPEDPDEPWDRPLEMTIPIVIQPAPWDASSSEETETADSQAGGEQSGGGR